MSAHYLRRYIREALRGDKRFIDQMKQHSNLRAPISEGERVAHLIASEWIADKEFEIGKSLPFHVVAQVERYAASTWQDLLEQYRHDKHAAAQTMNNLLSTKFDSLKERDPRWE